MNNLLRRLSSQEIVKVLKDYPFLYFILSVVFSQVAYNMMNVVMIFLIFYLTASNFSVSILVLIILVPQVILSFLGGIVADLKSKKKVLFYGNLLRGLAILLLFFFPNSKLIVYMVALIVSVITQFYLPAETPIISYLVKRKNLIGANSLFGISLFGSIFLGYVLAGPATQIFGRSFVFIILAFLFLIASFFVALIPSKLVHARVDDIKITHITRSLKDEIHHLYLLLRYSTEIGSAFFLLISSQVVVLILATVIPGYAKQILNVVVEDLSFLVFAPAAFGMIISALMVGGVFNKVDKHKLMNIGVLLSALVLVSFPFINFFSHANLILSLNMFLPSILQIDNVKILFFLAFLAGYANALIFIPSQTIIQIVVPEYSRSKIFGLLFTLIGAFSLIPVIIAGGVADVFGVGSVLIGMGVAIFVIGMHGIRSRMLQKRQK